MPKLRSDIVRGDLDTAAPATAVRRSARAQPPSLDGFTHVIEIGIGDPADVRVQLADAACAGALQSSVTLSGVRRLGRLKYAVQLEGRGDRDRLARIVARLLGPALTEYDDYDLSILPIVDGVAAATPVEVPIRGEADGAEPPPAPAVADAAGPTEPDAVPARTDEGLAQIVERLARLEAVAVDRLARIDGALEATVAALPTQLGATAEVVECLARLETRLIEAAERPTEDLGERFDRLETLAIDGFSRLSAPAPTVDDSRLLARIDALDAAAAERESAAARRSGDLAAVLQGLVACETQAAAALGELRARAAETAGSLDVLAGRHHGTEARGLAVAEASMRELAELRVDIAKLAAAQLVVPTAGVAVAASAPVVDPALTDAVASLAERVEAVAETVAALAARPAEAAAEEPLVLAPSLTSERDSFARVLAAFRTILRRFDSVATRAEAAPTPETAASAPVASADESDLRATLDALVAKLDDLAARQIDPAAIPDPVPAVEAAVTTLGARIDALSEVVETRLPPTTSGPNLTPERESLQRILAGLRLAVRDLGRRGEEVSTAASRLDDVAATLGAGLADRIAETVAAGIDGASDSRAQEEIARAVAALDAAAARFDAARVEPPAPEPTPAFDRVPTEAFAAEKARFERLLIGYRLVLKQLYETVASAQGVAVDAEPPSQAVDIEAAMNAAVRQVREEIAGQFAEGLARIERAKRLGAAAVDVETAPTELASPAETTIEVDAARALARFAKAVERLEGAVTAARTEAASDGELAERLETAAAETRGVLGELLSVAAALSRDLDAKKGDHAADSWGRVESDANTTRTKRRKGRGALI